MYNLVPIQGLLRLINIYKHIKTYKNPKRVVLKYETTENEPNNSETSQM